MRGNFNLSEPSSLDYAKGMERYAASIKIKHDNIINKYSSIMTYYTSGVDMGYVFTFKESKNNKNKIYFDYQHIGSHSYLNFIIQLGDGSVAEFCYNAIRFAEISPRYKFLDDNKYDEDLCCDFMVNNLLGRLNQSGVDKFIKVYGIRYLKKLLKISGATNKYVI